MNDDNAIIKIRKMSKKFSTSNFCAQVIRELT